MTHTSPKQSALPLELFLNILDQLVGTRDGTDPIAHPPANSIARTLRSLTLVSRDIYPIASRYLYSNCLYLDTCTSYARLRRTLGLNLGYHPQALHGQSSRNDVLFADIPQHITSVFISPLKSDKDESATPMVRLPQIIDLCKTIGRTLKRLALDIQPVYTVHSEVELVKPYSSANNIFLHMPKLEELVTSYDALDCFPAPPPSLKRLAITFQELKETQLEFCFSISSLQTLVFLRPVELLSTDIDLIFSSYKGKALDVMLVDVNSNHRTPTRTRTWKDDDFVKMWEVDVPTSFYGDDDELILCDNFIWTQGVRGTLWTVEKRRMASWADIQRRLAGPVHLIMDAATT
ncbi:hypothetical protein BKA63DRAFT_294064 [Paraphoma chrysanthemicola]|nr:hypothetical protein BKA63DRAFT_294064 [Paraphoma chrysanthemicola]